MVGDYKARWPAPTSPGSFSPQYQAQAPKDNFYIKKKKNLCFEFLFKQRSLSLSSLSRLENGVGCCIPERGPFFSATH